MAKQESKKTQKTDVQAPVGSRESRLAQQKMRAAFQAAHQSNNDGELVRHPNSIFTPEQIRKLLNSPTGNWFKRVLASLQVAFSTAKQLLEMQLVGAPAKLRAGNRHKSKRTSQASGGGESEKSGKADRVDWFKGLFANAYNKLLDLSASLVTAIITHDRQIDALAKQQLPELTQTLRDLDEDQLTKMAEKHAAELGLDKSDERSVVDEAAKAHRHAFAEWESGWQKDRAFTPDMQPGFAKALREKFDDRDEPINSEDACCAFVEHQFMSRVSDNRNPTLRQGAPAYELLQRAYQQKLFSGVGLKIFEQIAHRHNEFRQRAKNIGLRQADISEGLEGHLRSADSRVAQSAQADVLNQLNSRIQQVMGGLRNAYAGSSAPKPSQSAGRRHEEEEESQQQSSYTSPNPFSTRPTPPWGGSGSA
jgi:hypothetical protein